jgi:ADP-L-glycero-D-manno-heptose 6-epimerase
MILLTGGAGFIGSHVIDALNARDITDILIVDDLTDGWKSLNLVNKTFADYRDWRDIVRIAPEAVLRSWLPKFDGIIHLGAISDTVFTNGKVLMEQNYEFSKRMLQLAIRNDCPLVYASSASVYGDGKLGFIETPCCERPKSPYAVSKWMFDNYVRQVTDERFESNIAITGLRYFNVYGPGERHKGRMASFVSKCFWAIEAHEPIEVFEGSDNIWRDFVYVKDAAALTVKCLEAQKTGIFNIGTGNPVTFRDVAELAGEAGRAAKYSVEIRTVPFPKDLRAGYQRYTESDLTRLSAAIPGITANWFTSPADGIHGFGREFFKQP